MQTFPNIIVTENKNYNSKEFCKLYFNICFIKCDDGIQESRQ